MAVININFQKLARKLTPHFLRKPRLLAYLNSMAKALKDVNILLITLRDEIEFKLTFDAQIIYLEKYLNDIYDPANRDIFIEDGANVVEGAFLRRQDEDRPPVYIYRNSEIPPQLPRYFYRNSEFAGNFDYIINIKTGTIFDEDVLRAQVNVYNLAGKTYTINVY